MTGGGLSRSSSAPDASRSLGESQASLGSSKRISHQKALFRSDTDLSQLPSLASYELRPQAAGGTHTGQLVAKSLKKSNAPRPAPGPSPAAKMLAAVDVDVKAAAKLLRIGEPREAVVILQRAYRKAETSDASVGKQAAGLARAEVRLQLATVYSSIGRERDAVEEAVSAMLEADAAWQAMLAASAETSPSTEAATETLEPQAADAALCALLQNPPPLLQRTAEASVLTRCRAAASLQVAAATSGARDEALGEASGLLHEAKMLGRHFLPNDHPARVTAERAIEGLSAASEDQSAGEASGSLGMTAFDPSSPLSGLSEEEMRNWKAAQEAALPPLSGLRMRQRLPPSREGTTISPPGSSVGFRDPCEERELFTPPSAGGPPGPATLRPESPPMGWTGRVPAGDVYVSSLPKPKLPRLTGSGKKSKKKAAEEPTELQLKRAEGAAGGLSRSVGDLQIGPKPPDAFQDWLTSFDDPFRADIKRMVMRSEEACKRFTGDLKNKSEYFKGRILKEMTDEELEEVRIKYCGYGIRATKIAEKRQAAFHEMHDLGESEESLAKKVTRLDLFKYYRVDPGKSGEPNMKTLGKLLQESEPGRDRCPRRHLTKAQQATQDMQAMFAAQKKAADEEKAEGDDFLGTGMRAAFHRSSTAIKEGKEGF